MPEYRLIQAPSAENRLRAAEHWLETRINKGQILFLCTHLESADHLTRKLASRVGSILGLRRLTLDGLAYSLALPVLVENGLTPHSRLAEEAIAARIIQEMGSDGRLGPFESVARWPGLARSLASTLGELRLHGIHAVDLERASARLEHLGELLERYEATSLSAGVADRPRVLETATDVTRRTESPPIGLPTLLLDIAISSPKEQALVVALAEKAPELLATSPSGDTPSIRALEQALQCAAEVQPTHEDASQAIDQLQSYLFLSETPPTPSEKAREEVLIVSAPGEAQESVEVARAIQAEAETGLPFDSMAVLLRSPDVYTPLLEDAFARAGIPAYFASGTLRPDPAGRAFLALLDCAADQLSASRFAEYLSLGQLPKLDETGGHGASVEEPWAPPRHDLAPALPAGEPQQLDLFAVPEKVPEPEEKPAIEGTLRAPRRWERLLVDAAVIGGRDRWERRLAGLRCELEQRLKELDDPEGIDAGTIHRQIEDLTHLKRFALPLIDELGALPARAKWGAWLNALSRLATRALASPDGVLSILGELRPMDSVGPVELFEVREVLSERLTLLSQEPPKYRYGRVWIAPIESARGMSFDVVVVPGLAERMFPRKIVEDPLLLDAQRREVSEALATQDDRIAEERLALRLAAGAARRKIIFSYPSVDLQKGRSKVPSFYLLEVARASRGELPDFETLERAAAASSGARLGWPAPRESHRAIDETELDLAFLSEALRFDTDESEARGTGRYLMAVNPALARSLRARYLRNRPGKFSPSDGLLDPSSETRRTLEGYLLSAQPYSVTALEKYAACPYRFFLHALVRLRPRETVEHITHMDALTHGRIMHEAQFEISKALEDGGLYPIRPKNISRVLSVCEKTFDRVSARFAEELAPAIERIWLDEIDVIRANLRGWLQREAEAPDAWTPLRREFTFGMRPHGPADPTSVLDEAVLANGIRLRGAIDLVERSMEGRVRVTDYKSGRAWVPKEAVVNGGETLQPILYALAYEALTGELVSEARLYYCTQKGGYEQRRFVPDEEALEIVAEFKRRLDRAIADGFFPASPKPPLGCSYCDYRPVCGPRAEIDAERKQKDSRLSPLNWLRNLT